MLISNSDGDDGIGFNLAYRMGALRAVMRTQTTEWFLTLPTLDLDVWYNMEFAWSLEGGFSIHANNNPLASSVTGITRAVAAVQVQTTALRIGR